MSRRYNNRPQAQAAPQAAPHSAPQAAPPALSKPVQVDPSKMELLDMKLFMLLPQLARDEAAAQAAMPQLFDMLERVVVGGLAGRPITEFWPLVRAVGEQLQQIGNPKN